MPKERVRGWFCALLRADESLPGWGCVLRSTAAGRAGGSAPTRGDTLTGADERRRM